MDNATYAALTRQSGLLSEMRAIANNIANANTTGYRAEEVGFAEYIAATGPVSDSLSMASAEINGTLGLQGALGGTGGTFDLAIEGEGYFLIQTPAGERLTRAGNFTPNDTGDLVTMDGYPVLDPGGSPVFVPAGAGPIGVAPDGTISADGAPIGQIGIVRPLDPIGMRREDGVRFAAPGGYEPVENPQLAQGFLEESNVDPILQISRMIDVQRAYELGQSFVDKEDERIRNVIRTLGR